MIDNMNKIKLHSPHFSTYNHGVFNIYFNGFILYEGKQFVKAKDIYDNYLCKLIESNDHDILGPLKNDFLKNANGKFSLIIEIGNTLFLAADIVRSQPVFIIKEKNSFLITDSLKYYYTKYSYDIDYVESFIACNLEPGERTVFNDIIALQAGEIALIDNGTIKAERYFKFVPTEKPRTFNVVKEFADEYDKIMLKVFSDMLSVNKANNWIVPLSGGHDSRLTVNYLYRLGVKNVICFSYGNPGNEQSVISKKVADALGYRWYFVEYTEEKWFELQQKGLFDDYIRHSFNGVSAPHFQDFLAIYELIEKNIIGENDVVLKSHGDFVAGNHLTENDILIKTKDEAVKRVVKQHTRIIDDGSFPYDMINSVYDDSNVGPQLFPEYFNWQERQAKLMINSIRVYDFFNIKSALPYWDNRNVNFWLDVSSKHRVARNLFLQSEQYLLTKEISDIEYAGQNKKSSRPSLARLLIRLLPSQIIVILLKLTGRKVYLNEGLNKIYSLKANSVKELLEPLDDFPHQIRSYFNDILNRYPYQVNENFISVLYTIRRIVFDKNE